MPDEIDTLTFDGSNWQELTRLVALAHFKFLQSAALEDDPYAGASAKCAYLCSRFSGPALDWAASQLLNPTLNFANFDAFVTNARNQFGISDDGLRAQHRGQLEALKWQTDLPIFFAEFDRLCTLMHLQGDEVKIAMVRSKLPVHVQKLLAEQALDFHDYGTMRERLLTMWNLDPNKQTAVSHVSSGSTSKRPRCGRCGKKGHTASECRTKK